MGNHKRILQTIIANLLKSNARIIDTETTGLKYFNEIVEISVINMKGEVLLDTLVKPSRPIPAAATEIHHITNEMVADAPSWVEVYPQLMEAIGSHKWVGWKSSFDARLITQTCQINGLYDDLPPAQLLAEYERIHGSQFDAKNLYSEWFGVQDRETGNFVRQRLSEAVRQMGLPFQTGAHRSLADCYSVLHVLNCASKWVDDRDFTMATILNHFPVAGRLETTAGNALFDVMAEKLRQATEDAQQ